MSQLLADTDDTGKSHIGIDFDIVPEFTYWIHSEKGNILKRNTIFFFEEKGRFSRHI